MRALLKIAVMLAAVGAFAAQGQEWSKFTDAEQKSLLRGEVVYKSIKTTDSEGKLSGYGQSMVLVNATPEKAWEIFTQFDKQAEYFPRKTVSAVLDSKPGFALVQKKFKFYWVTIAYVNQYRIDAKNHRIDFAIDQSKPHDIKDSAGFFLFEKVEPQKTLFIYGVTRLSTGIAMPAVVQEYMQKKDLPAVADNVRKRIESNGTWKKE